MTGAARQNGPVRRRRNDAEQHLHFKLKSLNDVVCASQQQVPGRGLGAGGWKPTGSPPQVPALMDPLLLGWSPVRSWTRPAPCLPTPR